MRKPKQAIVKIEVAYSASPDYRARLGKVIDLLLRPLSIERIQKVQTKKGGV